MYTLKTEYALTSAFSYQLLRRAYNSVRSSLACDCSHLNCISSDKEFIEKKDIMTVFL